MADIYKSYAVSALTDIPTLVAAFAQEVGWTVDTTVPAAPVFTHPSYAQAEPFQLSYAEDTSGGSSGSAFLPVKYFKRLIWTAKNSGVATSTAVMEAPRLSGSGSGTGNPVMPAPTALHVFCALTPEPYIAIVVAFGANLYRHLYFGYAEKSSSYEGGEIITGSGVAGDEHGYKIPILQYGISYAPFCGTHNFPGNKDMNGGMRIVHANNATPWRRFDNRDPASSSWNSLSRSSFDTFFAFADSNVLGGYGDSVNSGYMMAGCNPTLGSNALAPVNLYIGKSATTPPAFQFVGRPSGVRLADMHAFDPESTILIGTQTWKLFPILAREETGYFGVVDGATSGGSTRWFKSETSGFAGMAYLVSDSASS